MAEKMRAGVIGTLAGVAADISMYGGEILISTLLFIAQDAGMILSFMAYLSTYASRVAWIPEGSVEQAYQVVLALVLVVLAFRMVRAWANSVRS